MIRRGLSLSDSYDSHWTSVPLQEMHCLREWVYVHHVHVLECDCVLYAMCIVCLSVHWVLWYVLWLGLWFVFLCVWFIPVWVPWECVGKCIKIRWTRDSVLCIIGSACIAPLLFVPGLICWLLLFECRLWWFDLIAPLWFGNLTFQNIPKSRKSKS